MRLFDEKFRWYKGNLHTHTTRSDGMLEPEQVITYYRKAGYDFLALTDHWVLSQSGWRDTLLLLGGVELDTMVGHQGYHIVGIGLERMPKLQRGAPMTPQQIIDGIRQEGGRAILAHPAWSLLLPSQVAKFEGLSGAEVMNSVSRTPFNGDRADSSVLLDTAAAQGGLLPLTAADDSHFYRGEQGQSFIWVNAPELTESCVLAALDKGAFFASQGPRFYQIAVEDGRVKVWCSPVSRAIFYSDALYQAQRVQSGQGTTYFEYPIGAGDGFVRVELVDNAGRKAWSSPMGRSLWQ